MSDPAPDEPHRAPAAAPWAAVRALFDRVVELPGPEREAALAASGAPPDLLAEVRELLRHAQGNTADAFLASPLAAIEPDPQRAGQRLGAWRIDALLGRGGMGEVWLARRADGAFEGRAAIKVLRRGMDSDAVLARFAQEQRALARLNHPHIARLLDAGRTADAQPYFVMEEVEGETIERACVGRSIETRLALFLQLADAVAHAHRQLLVHRDLKPSNVLVTAAGEVKLLDFGIAKALDPLEGADAQATVFGERPFTPWYASPEQVRGEPVGTATDIYSLGVLLYQMLTGQRPYGRDAATAADAARSVLETAPTRPSALTPPGDDPGWAARRRRLEGDLDHILLKALDKRIEARYASVDAFAADIRAHLAGLPVSAQAPRLAYLAGRFVHRHRAAVTAAALGVLGLVGGLAASLWQAHEAALARDAARERLAQTRAIVRDIVMRHGDAITYLPGGMKLKLELLGATVAHLDRLAADAAGDPAFAGDLAMAYARMADLTAQNLGASLERSADAARYAERALALFTLGEPAHRQEADYVLWWGRAMRAQANGRRERGDAAGALRWRERQRDLLQAAIARGVATEDVRSELGSALIGIGQAYDSWGVANLDRPAEAQKAFDAADTLFRGLAAESPRDYTYPYQRGTVAGARLLSLAKQGRYSEAVAHGREAVALRRVALAIEPGNVALREGLATETANFAAVLLDLDRSADALTPANEALALIEALQREEPQAEQWRKRARWFRLHRGRALLGIGRMAEAQAELRAALSAMASATEGVVLRRRALAEVCLGEAELGLGRRDEARRQSRTARADLQRWLAGQPDDPEGLVVLAEIGALDAALAADPIQARARRSEALAQLAQAQARAALTPAAQALRSRLQAPPH